MTGHPTDLLSAYLDGEAPPEDRVSIEDHLNACAACRLALDDFRALAMAAAGEAAPAVPGDLRARIRLRVEAERSAAPKGRWAALPTLALLAVTGAAIVVGVWTLRVESPRESQIAQVQEPAAAPALPSAALEEKRQEEASRSLGYLAGKERSKAEATAPPPMAEANQERIAGERVRRQAAKPAPIDGPRPAPAEPETPRASRDDVADGVSSGVIGFAVGDPASTGTAARWVEFEYPGYSVDVSEAGTLALRAEGYACAVEDAGEADGAAVRALFAAAEAVLRERRVAGSTARRDEAAKSTVPVVRLRIAPGAARVDGAAPRAAPSFSAVPDAAAPRGEVSSSGAAVRQVMVSQPGAAEVAELERRLNALLRDRYLGLLDRRCGQAPGVPRAE